MLIGSYLQFAHTIVRMVVVDKYPTAANVETSLYGLDCG
jgi:hypothetical protein